MVVREFHPLRVAAVERLCDDAVAVTFDVPRDLADRYAFRPGQSLTVKMWLVGDGEAIWLLAPGSAAACSPPSSGAS